MFNEIKLSSSFVNYYIFNSEHNWEDLCIQLGINKLENYPWKYMHLTRYGFSTTTCQLINFLVRSLSWQLNKAFTLGTKRHSFGRHHGVYSIGKPWTSHHHQNPHLMLSNISFLLKSGTLSHLTQKEIRSPSP
jgi:hypothetical protein